MQELVREYLARDTECTMQLNTSMGNVDSEFLRSFADKEPPKMEDISTHMSVIPPQRRPQDMLKKPVKVGKAVVVKQTTTQPR